MTNTTPRHGTRTNSSTRMDTLTGTHRHTELREGRSEAVEVLGPGGSCCHCSPLPLAAPGWGETGNPQPLGGAAPGGLTQGPWGAPGRSFHPTALCSSPAHTKLALRLSTRLTRSEAAN